MQKKLDAQGERFVKVSVFVAATTHKITDGQIAQAFGMSVSTLGRYKYERNRERSRLVSREQHLRLMHNTVHGVCSICKDQLETHPRCRHCDILLHHPSYRRIGTTFDGKYCVGCIDYGESVPSNYGEADYQAAQ